MIKKLLTIFLITAICICSSISVSAYTEQYVFDYENALSYDEIQELESTAEQIENEYGYCVMFCITDEETNENYAQNIYDTYTDNENGIIFVHNTESEMYHYYVTESANSTFDLIKMQDAYDSNNSYFGGIEDFYTVVENSLSYDDAEIKNTDADVYTTGNKTDSSKSPVKTIVLCIVVGMAMGFIIILAIASKNKSVRMQKNATIYTRPGSFVVTGSYDNFLYKNLVKTPKPKQENKK